MASKYTLTALESFKCLAADCPANCCSYGWDISVDKATLKKWQGIKDPTLRTVIFEALFEQEIDGVSEKMVGSKGQICSLRDERGLCLIHDKLGEEYLGNTCRRYPRVSATFTGYSLDSAAMSCPEVARLVVE